MDRPYVLIKSAMSVDGLIDDAADRRLILSNHEDFARVDAARAECDAIMVGAGTIRADNPRLLVRAPENRERRISRGTPPDPVKVTLTRSGDLDPSAQFFQAGESEKLVYCPRRMEEEVRRTVGDHATVIGLDSQGEPEKILADLFSRGVRKLMIEGGSQVNSLFLQADGLVDEIQLSIAPCLIGDQDGTRFVNQGDYPFGQHHRMELAGLARVGDMVEVRFLLRRQ